MVPHPDHVRATAAAIIQAALDDDLKRPVVQSFSDTESFTISHVVRDPGSKVCAIIDGVLGYDASAGRTSPGAVQPLIDYVKSGGLEVQWILETDPHADHLSAARCVQGQPGGQIAIEREIVRGHQVFGKIFNARSEFRRDGSQFDHLFQDGDRFSIGGLDGLVLHVPGHTPACLAYVIGDALFSGDTLLMVDCGTGRCDLPGGEPRTLFPSVQRLISLPDSTRIFLCHNYKAPGWDTYEWETSVSEQRQNNIRIRESVAEDDLVAHARRSG